MGFNLSAILCRPPGSAVGCSGVLSVRCTKGLVTAALMGSAVAYDDSDGDDEEHGVGYIGTLNERTLLSLALEMESAPHAVALDGQSEGGYAIVQVHHHLCST